MTIPFMFNTLVFVPKIISYIGLVILVVAGIAEFRQGHIGRIGIAANAFLLWQIFFPIWTNLPILLQWYLNIGTIFAIIALVAYIIKIRLPTEYYQIAFIGYGSFSVILAIAYLFII